MSHTSLPRPSRTGVRVLATVLLASGLIASTTTVASARPADSDTAVTVDEDGYTPAISWLMGKTGGKPLRVNAGPFTAADGLGSVDLDVLKQNAAWRIVAPMRPKLGQTVILTWDNGSTTTFKVVCLTGSACVKVIDDEAAPTPAPTPSHREPGAAREGGIRERMDADIARSNERWLQDALQRSNHRIPIVTVGPLYQIR